MSLSSSVEDGRRAFWFSLLSMLLCCLICWAVGFGVRALEAPAWDDPRLGVDGEVILSTHDAYAWLAGARGLGTGVGTPMAGLVDAVARATGASLGNAAFWLPAVLGGLVGAAAALWGWTLGGGGIAGRAGAALCAGLAASLAPGFYQRTRLGWYDTDLMTLLLPLVQAWALGHWLTPWLRSAPFLRAGPAPEGRPGLVRPLLAGLLVLLGSMGWHSNLYNFAVLMLILALVLVLALGRPGCRARLAWGLVLFALAGFGGLIGLILGAAAALLDSVAPQRAQAVFSRLVPALAILIVLMAGTGLVRNTADTVVDRFRAYTKTTEAFQDTTESRSDNAPIYPGVIQSVREAQTEPLSKVLGSLSASAWLSVLGLLGFAAACLVRPALVLLAPLVAMSLAGVTLGARMTMFGGPGVALGLALPLCWLARSALALAIPARPALARAVVLAVGLLAGTAQAGVLAVDYSGLGLMPILTNRHVTALRALGRIAPPDALVWTWWDFGYATQYYAGLRTFADGARHGGRYLYPLGVAMASDSPLQSVQMMGYAALKDGRPWTVWNALGAEDVRAFVHSLALRRYDLSVASPSYLVVCWENIRLMPWITYFGSWDVVGRTGRHGKVMTLPRDFDLSLPDGVLNVEGNDPLPLADMHVLDGTGRRSRVFREQGPHLVVNDLLGQAVLLDDQCYRSMLFRLLIADPGDPELAPWFRLVHEGAPLVRVYEVLYPGRGNGQ